MGCAIKAYVFMALALLNIGAESGSMATPRRGLAGEQVFDATKYGAVPNGQTDSAMGLIKAWNAACQASGPARMLIPKGDYVAKEIVFQGPCTAKPVTIEIQGNLLASTDLSDFTQGAWIQIEQVDNIVVTGDGTINGRGEESYRYSGSDGYSLLPVSLIFQRVNGAELSNLNFLNSKGFHMKVTDSQNVAVSQIKITAPGDSPNTDGIHLSSASHVNITDSVIGTGDDCISIGEGTTNIFVARITCGPGHGISVGSLGKRPDEKNLQDITVINCTLTGTSNGARIKTYHASPELKATGIIYEDILMNEVRNPIIIDQHYDSKSKAEQSKVTLSDVTFKNIRGTTVSPIPISLNCSTTHPCDPVQLVDINLTPAANMSSKGPLQSVCSSAKVNIQGEVNPAGPAKC